MTPDLMLREVACESVRVSRRHRRAMGDLDALAASIAAEGLLQPIGITEDSVLVFGERRLLAVRDILKHATVAARIVHVSSIVAGEYAENEIRKDFTASERVAIGKALEAELGDRRGMRTDMEHPQNIAEVEPGLETREIAAKKAGFGNRTTYEQAKKVVEKAVDEVVAQMDSERIAVSAAAVIADEPPERQREIAAMPPTEQRKAVRKLRRKELPTPAKAQRRAKETGMAILDRNLEYQLPVSMEERRPLIERNLAVMAVIDATCDIAKCSLTASDVAAGIREFDTPDMDFGGRCHKAAAFLQQVAQELA
jgi:ParB family chromosome partitioning protein